MVKREKGYSVLITPPVVEPVSVVEIRTHTRIVGTVEDDLLRTWISSGRKLAEDYQNRAYLTQTWNLIFDHFPKEPFYIPRAPLVSLVSIKYYGIDNTEYTVSPSVYFVDTIGEVSRVGLSYGCVWPALMLRSLNGVIIKYTAGYGSSASYVPASVKDALYLYCSWRYDNRAGESSAIPFVFYQILDMERVFV